MKGSDKKEEFLDFPADISQIEEANFDMQREGARDSIMSMAQGFEKQRGRSPLNFKPMLDEDDELRQEKQRIAEGLTAAPPKDAPRETI